MVRPAVPARPDRRVLPARLPVPGLPAGRARDVRPARAAAPPQGLTGVLHLLPRAALASSALLAVLAGTLLHGAVSDLRDASLAACAARGAVMVGTMANHACVRPPR